MYLDSVTTTHPGRGSRRHTSNGSWLTPPLDERPVRRRLAAERTSCWYRRRSSRSTRCSPRAEHVLLERPQAQAARAGTGRLSADERSREPDHQPRPQRLEDELATLEGDGRRAIAERIKTAREWGDLKENSEYHDAKNEQAHLETKIARLREQIAGAVVVEDTETADGVVGLGSTVVVARRGRGGADLADRQLPRRPRARGGCRPSPRTRGA